jgi:hypothetical protein
MLTMHLHQLLRTHRWPLPQSHHRPELPPMQASDLCHSESAHNALRLLDFLLFASTHMFALCGLGLIHFSVTTLRHTHAYLMNEWFLEGESEYSPGTE